MATLQNIGKLKYRGKDGLWHPLPVVVQDAGSGVSTISGKGAPTSETQGKVNQLYRDEDTQRLYICTATDGGYTWAEVSGGGSVDIDATLTQAGQAADAKAAGDAIGKKLDKAQGTENAGKILGIGADGNVTPQDKPVQSLAGAATPTTATAGVVGQEYYVIVNGAVTEMYVCTAVSNGTYTWGKVEFGAEETDPTVPAWAKEAHKPSYTASEVGADPSGTAASQVSAHNTGTDTHSDIRLLISGLTDRLNALADSDDTTLDQLSEVVAYIKINRTLIESITTNKVSVSDIIDNLTTNVINKPLSAAQGVALKALIDAISIPDKLPNPNALTFTGAVSGSYDGSAPLSVNIPSGGGSGVGGTDVALGMSGASVGQIAKITAVDGSGMPTAWEPVDLPSGGSQADWNQNNSDASDYVKNRTHYEEYTYVEQVCDANGVDFDGSTMPNVGETMTVKINGVESVETVKEVESIAFEGTKKYIGNIDPDSIINGGSGWCVIDFGFCSGFANPNTTIGIKCTVVHKIDDKFVNFDGLTRTFDHYVKDYTLYGHRYKDDGTECTLYMCENIVVPNVYELLFGYIHSVGFSKVESTLLHALFITGYEFNNNSIIVSESIFGTSIDEIEALASDYGFTHRTNPTA